MRILWLSHMVPYPPKAGLIQRSYHLLRELARQHQVTLLALNQRSLMSMFYPQLSEGVLESRTALEHLCTRVEIIDLPYEYSRYGKARLAATSLFSSNPFSVRRFESSAYASALAALDPRSYDLVHFDSIGLAQYRDLCFGTTLVLNHHNVESHLMLRRSRRDPSALFRAYAWQEGLRLRRYEANTAKAFSLHVTCSHLDSERLREVNADVDVEVIPNGVDTEYYLPANLDAEPATLMFMGTLGWGPNRDAVETIVNDLWPVISAKLPQLRFSLVGANPPPSATNLAGRDTRFHCTHFVDDVRPFLARATVFICPIDDGGGTKLKLLDALAMGKPIIAHPTACEGVEVVDGVHLLTARTAEEYVTALSGLLESRQLRELLGRNGRKLVEEKYSYASIGKRIIARYEEVANTSTPKHTSRSTRGRIVS